jgi:hypothetical protein
MGSWVVLGLSAHSLGLFVPERAGARFTLAIAPLINDLLLATRITSWRVLIGISIDESTASSQICEPTWTLNPEWHKRTPSHCQSSNAHMG